MSAAPAHLDGWKRISAHIGRSERWCRYMAKRPVRPLPVGHLGGMVRMSLADYEAWLRDEMAAPKEPCPDESTSARVRRRAAAR